MYKLKEDAENQLSLRFEHWNNFNAFITKLEEENINKIFLSSVVAEPMMYKHLHELVKHLIGLGFNVGVRTNGYFFLEKIDTIKMMDAEISLSINSLNCDTNQAICGVHDLPDYDTIFDELYKLNKSCRVSIVINRFNRNEIFQILDYLSTKECVSYVQLRKIYKYDNSIRQDDANSFDLIKNELSQNFQMVGNYYESQIFDYQGLKVSIWENVFKKSSIRSINYFTNGLISTNNLLIPAYEKGEVE
jgi:wyosine [tRNA(Phe)-imidazoG37] synthetase (radical SAM superfamily)